MQRAEQLLLNLYNPALRESALQELCQKRYRIQDLAPMLWGSFGSIAVLLEEIVSIYRILSSPDLTMEKSLRVCHALSVLQCVASHMTTRKLYLDAYIPLYVYPFLSTTGQTMSIEYLRVTGLGVIAAMVKENDPSSIRFLLSTQIIPCCLRSMEMGGEVSKSDDAGLHYICIAGDQFFAVVNMLSRMVANRPSTQTFRHVIGCFFKLSEDPRTCDALRSCLSDLLGYANFAAFLHEDDTMRMWLEQLLANVQ